MSQRLDPEILVTQSEPRGVAISPDGKHVVYTSRPAGIRDGEHIKASLWTADVSKEDSARQLTQGEYNDFSPKYSPDGKYICFISDRQKPGQTSVLYLLPLDGGEAFPLTSKENEMGIETYAWSPDSKTIAFASADEKSEERKATEKESDIKVHDEIVDRAKLRLIHIGSKESVALKTAEGHVAQIAWHESGTKIAYATWQGPNFAALSEFGTDIHVANVKEDTTRKIGHTPTVAESLAWNKDKLIYVGNYQPDSWTTGKSLFTIDPAEQSPENTWAGYGETNCASELIVRSNTVVFKLQEGLRDTLMTLDGKELFSEKTSITSWDANFSSGQAVVALTHSVVGKPTEVYSVVEGQKTQLTQHGRSLTQKTLGEAHLCEYTHEDGTPIDGYYGIPASLKTAFDKGEPSPTIVLVHGGPYARVSNSFDLYWSWTPFFMSLGYLVLVPNYRGGAGHGHKYANAVSGDASQSYQDVIWLVKKGVEEGRIDKDRVGMTGWSQGGYMSYLALTRDDQFHFAAVSPGAGVSDWSAMCLTSDIPVIEGALSGPAPWSLRNLDDIQSRKCSPLYYMQNINTPALLLHGEQDPRVPLEQAVGFYRGMKARGKDVTLVTYPKETHCFPIPFRKRNNIDMLERQEKFFGKHLGKP